MSVNIPAELERKQRACHPITAFCITPAYILFLSALPPTLRGGRFLGTPAPRQAVNQAIPVRPTVQLPYKDSKRLKRNTINVAPGETWNIEFLANNPGNWVFHCHKPHHTTNMHSIKNMGGMLTMVRYAKKMSIQEKTASLPFFLLSILLHLLDSQANYLTYSDSPSAERKSERRAHRSRCV